MSEWNIALWNWNFLIVVFFMFAIIYLGVKMGFTHVASGPMVRSSYHADQQARAANT